MKSATLPSLRVSPSLRKKAESLLEEGQTLSSLLETLIAEGVEGRLTRKDFVDQSLAGAREADANDSWIPAKEVLAELSGRLKATPRARKARRR